MKVQIKRFTIIILLSFSFSEIIVESGSLREFIGGSSPSTSYDNYISHVSEGIASPGYNDYGPDWLDVQTDGFGNYRIIPGNSSTLPYWENIFLALLRGNISEADQLLTDSLNTFNYDLVAFTDTTVNRTFYMIRERLDYTYFDFNTPDTPLDDVSGSFRNGWGLFILNPNAARQQLLVEVPHPCDDFIAPYIATELFLQTDAFAMMIAGAGREVKWTMSGNYNNNKSKSDPSRNSNSPFHKFHTVLSDSLMQTGPHAPLVLHMHSFDDNESHEGFKSIVLSGGWDAGYANKPIRDVTDSHLDFVNFTMEYPIPANQYGAHDPLHVTDYYQVHYNGQFYYYGENMNYPITHTYSLLGPNTGVQMNYLRQFFHNASVYEPWVQVELHEKPVLFTQLNMPNTELYQGSYPTSYRNFLLLIEYYQPFIDAVQAYLTNWESVPDTQAPPVIEDIHSIYDGYHYVELEWTPVEDTNFKTYRIYYAPGEVTEDSPWWDLDNDTDLQDMRRNFTTITGLDENFDYNFEIKALDYFDNISPFSNSTTDSIPGVQSHIVIENFDDGEVEFNSYEGEDMNPNSWSLSTYNTYLNSPYSLRIYGNTWKEEPIDPVPVTEGTVWQISVRSLSSGEIHGFGLGDSANVLFYSIAGSEQLDIEEWVTVYQGYYPNYGWNNIPLPVADDWFARFEYYPEITRLIFVNDRDNDPSSTVYFDEIIDITPVLDIAPQVSFTYSVGELARHNDGSRTVSIQFDSTVEDPDSETHNYLWYFGDGVTSEEADPAHTFVVEDDHPYTVLLQVTDDTGYMGQATQQITVDEGESSFPLTLNFVGDIMLARRYEDDGGIIDTDGVEAIFEPTLPFLGEAADITVANLECPFTVYGTPHPTKSIIFKSHPDNAEGLVYAGVDVVTLANNHTTDYGLTGLINTQNTLADLGILFSGAGADSYQASLPLFYNQKGVNIAFLASSDRTGQYNNYQPYLNAGYDKPGFAYMTPYYLLQQIQSVEETADLIVMEFHAGSEYSTGPGANYDSFDMADYLDPINYDPPRDVETDWDVEDISDEEENYSPYLDVPQMWDREIRHFAIDSGADLVIVHHPHIIQGIEVYNGKVIAHSLGNFVFDLNYPETYPSMILNASVNETGFYEFSVTPVYIDDYIPQPAVGELGLQLLDYIAFKSRELDTYVHVDRSTGTAQVILDTLAMPVTSIANRRTLTLDVSGIQWTTAPLPIHRTGNITSIDNFPGGLNIQYRLGRELIWFGNMEDEGSTLWNVNSNDEWFDDSEAYRGQRSLTHRRTPTSGDNIVTNFENRIKINADNVYTLAGWIRTQNGSDVTIEIRFYQSRTTGTILSQQSVHPGVSGDRDWQYYFKQLTIPANAKFFDIRTNSQMPAAGEARSWFDDVSVIEWTDWEDDENSASIFSPNDYYFIQMKGQYPPQDPVVEFTETAYASLPEVQPAIDASQTAGLAPFQVQFFDESAGVTGWWEWDFGDGTTSIEKNPIHVYTQPGNYDVSLTVMDYSGTPLTLTMPGYIHVADEFMAGDLNFDLNLNVLDIVIMVNIIIGEIEPTPLQLELGDLNGDGGVNVLDVVNLINLILNGSASD